MLPPSLSLAGSFFGVAWSAARARWMGWSLFWAALFLFLNTALMFHPSGFLGQLLIVCVIQGGFPLFFLGLYTLNRRLETAVPRGWLSFFDWVKDKRVLLNALGLATFHLSFYVGLAFGSSFLGGLLTEKDAVVSSLLVMFGIHFVIGTTFLSLTWRMPALIAEGQTLPVAFKQSLASFRLYWKPISWLAILLHTPTAAVAYGVYACLHGLQTFAAEGRVPPPNLLIPALLETAPLGVHLVFWGMLIQFSFWMIVLCQGYSPAFWKKLPLPSAHVVVQ